MSRFSLRAPSDRSAAGGLRVRHLAAWGALAVVLLGSLTAQPSRAHAQETEGGISIALESMPVAYGTDDELGLKLEITNDSDQELPGFIVNVERGSRLTSRSDLENSFDNPVGFALDVVNRTVDKTLAPGDSATVTLDEPVTELFSDTDEEGIYPATVLLLDLGAATLIDSLTTHLMYYPEDTETRLNFVLTVPLNDLPARSPAGDFGLTNGDQPPLEEALGRGGWLTKTVAELNRLGGRRLRVGVAPTPRLIEEIDDMSNGYERDGEQVAEDSPSAEAAREWLAQLGDLLNTEGIQPLLVPYASPDLPSLAASDLDDHVGRQIATGEAVLRDTLDLEVDGSWIFPPGGRLDAGSLDLLQTAGAGEHTFFSGAALEEADNPLFAGCPIEELSLTCPVSVETPLGETLGYQTDHGLQDRLTTLVRSDDDRLNLQRFFAETAMIRQEQPGRGDRIVQATLPALWHPSPKLIRTLYRGIARAPWLQTVTPEEGFDVDDIEPVERRVVEAIEDAPNELDVLDYAAIAEADNLVDSFNSTAPPPALTQRLINNVLVSESRSWWLTEGLAGRGVDYAREALEEARGEMEKVSIEVNDRITLTSRAEDIPVRVLNDAGYPVKLRIELTSSKLRFEDERVQTFDLGRTPLSIPVRADTSGIFQITMSLVTPDGAATIAEQQPSVRSTEFNNIALFITIGALAFLIAFYVWRWYRARNSPAPQASD